VVISSRGAISNPNVRVASHPELRLDVHVRDPLPVPHVAVVLALHRRAQDARPEHRDALAAGVADAAVVDAVRSGGAERAGEGLGRTVAGGVGRIEVRPFGLQAGDVVQVGVDVGRVAAHVDLDRRLPGGGEEARAVKARLGDGRADGPGGVVHPVAAVGEAAALAVQMREGRHDRGGARPIEPVLRGHPGELAQLFPQAVVGQSLDLQHDVEIRRARHPVEDADRREAAGHQPPRGLPARAPDRRGHDQPLWASRYCRTTYRSATLPDSIRSSAGRPPNGGASLGRWIQPSATSGRGSRICKAL